MKILLTGATGQMGRELQLVFSTVGNVKACSREQFDLGNPEQMRKVIREYAPDLILNAAAYTAVDKAEQDVQTALQVNAEAPQLMAEEAKRLGAWFVHYSTDYVFDGESRVPYKEDSQTNPVNVYGQSKLKAEELITSVGGKHLILRTSWVYGWYGANFMRTMLKLAESRKELDIINDQLGAPTWGRALAQMTAQMVTVVGLRSDDEGLSGIYHLTAAGEATRYEFAKEIFRLRDVLTGKLGPTVKPITSDQHPLPAKRPMYSILSNAKLLQKFDLQMPDWKESLYLCLSEANQF